MGANDHAIVVGINSYPGCGNLRGAENDALAFEQWLTAPTGGALPPGNVTTILGSHYAAPGAALAAQPHTSDIDRAFEALIHRVQATPGDRLYVVLAGHGIAPSGLGAVEDAALLTANADRQIGTTGHHISGRSYLNWFRATGFFHEYVLFMDCCREAMPRAPLRVPPWQAIQPHHGRPTAHLFALATTWGRASIEAPIGPGGEVRGYFTSAVLDALQGWAADATGVVSGAALRDYVLNYIPQIPALRTAQQPEFDLGTGGTIRLATNVLARPTPIEVQFGGAAAAAWQNFEIVDGLVNPMGGPPTGNPWTLALPMGQYVVRSTNGPTRIPFQALGKAMVTVHVS